MLRSNICDSYFSPVHVIKLKKQSYITLVHMCMFLIYLVFKTKQAGLRHPLFCQILNSEPNSLNIIQEKFMSVHVIFN